jgi:hypothetical protein
MKNWNKQRQLPHEIRIQARKAARRAFFKKDQNPLFDERYRDDLFKNPLVGERYRDDGSADLYEILKKNSFKIVMPVDNPQ